MMMILMCTHLLTSVCMVVTFLGDDGFNLEDYRYFAAGALGGLILFIVIVAICCCCCCCRRKKGMCTLYICICTCINFSAYMVYLCLLSDVLKKLKAWLSLLFLKFTLLMKNCIHVYFHQDFVFPNTLVLSKYIIQ